MFFHSVGAIFFAAALAPSAVWCSLLPTRHLRALGRPAKVYLCHVPPDDPENFHTIHVSERGASAHLRNHGGDFLGPCSVNCDELCPDLLCSYAATDCDNGCPENPCGEGMYCQTSLFVEDALAGENSYDSLNREFWDPYCVGDTGPGSAAPCTNEGDTISVDSTGTTLHGEFSYIGHRPTEENLYKWIVKGPLHVFFKWKKNVSSSRCHATLKQVALRADGTCCDPLDTVDHLWGFGVWGGGNNGPTVAADYYDTDDDDHDVFYSFELNVDDTGKFSIHKDWHEVTAVDGAFDLEEYLVFYFGINNENEQGSVTLKDFVLYAADYHYCLSDSPPPDPFTEDGTCQPVV